MRNCGFLKPGLIMASGHASKRRDTARDTVHVSDLGAGDRRIEPRFTWTTATEIIQSSLVAVPICG